MIRQLLSPSHSYFSFGIICGRLWGSLAVEDHLRSRDHLRLGIICGTVQYQDCHILTSLVLITTNWYTRSIA